MTCFNFIEKYCEVHKLTLERSSKRLSGDKLLKIKLLCFIIKMYYNKRYTNISSFLLIHRQSAMLFYYEILKNKIYRDLANKMYEEIIKGESNESVGNIQESK